MAVITKAIPSGERSNEVTLIQRALISLGANIAPGELFTATTAGIYGTSTQTAVGALLDRFGIPHSNLPIPFNASVGRLLNITLQPPAPELLNPENYYTVVYDYVSRAEVQELFPGT